ncbi:hypothetical protein ACFE04_012992 [Oxalis oulophora]
MDRAQEELQFLSSSGVFKQSFTLIFKWKKIFTQITLALILPLFLIALVRSHIENTFIDKFNKDFDNYTQSEAIKKIVLFIVFEILYVTFLILFSLLSTSAVVYTIACIYAAKEITFKKVMSVVPRVWKRLLLTFIVGYAILFVFCFVGVLFLSLIIAFLGGNPIGIALIVIFAVLLLAGFIYIYMLWNLASVVSVLEKVKGCKAMKKSKVLIKGHLVVSIALFVFQVFAFGGISIVYEVFVVDGSLNLGVKILLGILCYVLMVIVALLVLVIQTVIYFVCKSYHHENIDRTLLADHLEASYGAYFRINDGPKELQLQPQPLEVV